MMVQLREELKLLSSAWQSTELSLPLAFTNGSLLDNVPSRSSQLIVAAKGMLGNKAMHILEFAHAAANFEPLPETCCTVAARH